MNFRPNPQSATSGENAGSAQPLSSMNQFIPTNQENDDVVQISPSHLWGAFRRRWLLAVFLGSIAAVPVAYLAWKYVPAPYVSEAEIQVLVSPPHTLYEIQGNLSNFRNFKAEQLKEVKHERILTQVLDNEDVMRLPMIREAKNKNPDLIGWLQEKLLVKSSSDEFFTISLEGEDPESLQKIVATITEVYLNSSVGGLRTSSATRIAELESKLLDRERMIEKTKEKIEAAGVQSVPGQRDLERESKLAELVDLSSDIRSAQRELNTLEAQLKVLETSGAEAPAVQMPSMSGAELDAQIKMDDRYRFVERRGKVLERQLKDYIESVNSETHPKIVELKKSIEQAKVDLDLKYTELTELYREEERKVQQVTGDQSVASLKIQIDNLKNYIEALAEERDKKKLADVETLNLQKGTFDWEEELNHDKDVANTIRTELEKLKFESNTSERILEYRKANLPQQRNMKKKYLLAGGGGFGAFGLMIALVTMLELRFMRISSLKHLENEFHFPILGTLPNLPARFMKGNDTSGKGEFYRHVFAESVDTTRTMIINLQKQKQFNTLMVTSALGGEGKSTLSCHLAISFARAGRKTLLVDADLRSPRVHEVFQMSDFPGICEAIRHELPIEKCITPTPIPRLSLLPAGELDAATMRLLAEDRVGEILKQLRHQYDMIIFDSAPIIPVNDTLLLLQAVDGIILSVRKDVTRISKLAAALSKIEMLGGKLFGAVVTGIGEEDYGYRSKYIKKYQSSVKDDSEEFEVAGAN